MTGIAYTDYHPVHVPTCHGVDAIDQLPPLRFRNPCFSQLYFGVDYTGYDAIAIYSPLHTKTLFFDHLLVFLRLFFQEVFDQLLQNFFRQLCGRVSFQDIFRAEDVISVSQDMDAHEAAEKIAQYQIKRLPVIENGNLV